MEPPLAGLRVWITRPGAAAARSVGRWEAQGAKCLAHPTLALAARALPAPEREDLAAFLDGARLLLTSANAARFLCESVAGDARLESALRALPASAVGEATAKAALARGLRVDHVASVALGVEAAREVAAARGAPARVVLPGSDKRRPEGEALLRRAGVEVLALTCYETRPVSSLPPEAVDALQQGAVDAVAVYSPSAVEGLLAGGGAAGWQPRRLPPCLSLGPTTTAAVTAAGLRLAAEASPPGEEELLRAAAAWWGGRERR